MITFSSMQQIGNAANANYFTHYTHLLNGAAIWQRGHHTITSGHDGRLIYEHQYGVGNPAGVIAFDATLTNGPTVSQSVPSNIQAARMGMKAALLEETDYIGGQMVQQGSATWTSATS